MKRQSVKQGPDDGPKRRVSAWMQHACRVLGSLLAGFSSLATGQVLWSEEFNGDSAPDESVWSFDLGAGGWGNGELQEYTSDPANIRIEDGHLVITALPGDAGSPFTSGRIRTQDKFFVRYGTIEARIMLPDLANGLWPAFWTLSRSFGDTGWFESGEIDVMEMGSVDAIAQGAVNRRVGSTAHWEDNGQRASFGYFHDAPADLNGAFHVFRLDWTPGSMTTYVDDAPVWTMDISPQRCHDCSELHEPHFMLLNMAVGGGYPQIFSPQQVTAPLPAEMRVDYVRIIDNGFSQLSGTSVEGQVPDVGPGHSGSWYSAAQSGHGFSIEIGVLPDGSPLAVVYWYVYDNLGNPVFFLGTGVPDGNELVVEFESPLGMLFGMFDPLSVVRERGGTGRFVFSDRGNAVFDYTPSGFSISNWGHAAVESLSLVKLFGIPVFDPGPSVD